MTTSDIKLLLFREIDSFPESRLMELQEVVLSYIYTVQKKKKPIKKRVFGSMKGTVRYIDKDFNAPLSDFNDYM